MGMGKFTGAIWVWSIQQDKNFTGFSLSYVKNCGCLLKSVAGCKQFYKIGLGLYLWTSL